MTSWGQIWAQTEFWQLLFAGISGIVVGVIYFESLRYSLSRLAEVKRKFAWFGFIALLRICLFFGVMILVAGKNIVLITIYLLLFFITRMIILGLEKKRLTAMITPPPGGDHV